MTDMNDKKLTNYLDKNFDKLIKRYDELSPEKFFITKWDDCEATCIYNRYAHIKFLSRFSEVEKDLYLLKYSLKHLHTLIDYYCKNGDKEEIKNTLIKLTISDWDFCPLERLLSFSFFITYKCHTLFGSTKPFVQPYTRQSFYIIELLKKLNIADDYFVYDDPPPIDEELQMVSIGLRKHPDPDLITLDHFVQ